MQSYELGLQNFDEFVYVDDKRKYFSVEVALIAPPIESFQRVSRHFKKERKKYKSKKENKR